MKPYERLYFVGIKGVGMSALAIFAKNLGIKVSGSDTPQVFITDRQLIDAGIKYFEGFKAKNIRTFKPQAVVVSAAYSEDNPEIKETHRRKIPILAYSELLGVFMKSYRGIAVAGIHGKTTTAAMIAFMLSRAGLDPSYIIGSGTIQNFGPASSVGKGQFFVAEADEYRRSAKDKTPKFLDLSPEIIVITSIEMDHPDMFATLDEVYDAFYRLCARIPRHGKIVVCSDYKKIRRLTSSIVDRQFITYGFSPLSDYRIIDLQLLRQQSVFCLRYKNQSLGPYILRVPGEHNVLNASAAIAVSRLVGVDDKTAQATLPEFLGVQRRAQVVGVAGERVLIDDYAHHPTAIATTLAGLKKFYPDHRIIVVFQPHTYSRTEVLLDDFARSFREAQELVVSDIYASEREKIGKVNSLQLVERIKKLSSTKVTYLKTLSKIVDFLVAHSRPGDIIVTMGAGDIYKIHPLLQSQLL